MTNAVAGSVEQFFEGFPKESIALAKNTLKIRSCSGTEKVIKSNIFFFSISSCCDLVQTGLQGGFVKAISDAKRFKKVTFFLEEAEAMKDVSDKHCQASCLRACGFTRSIPTILGWDMPPGKTCDVEDALGSAILKLLKREGDLKELEIARNTAERAVAGHTEQRVASLKRTITTMTTQLKADELLVFLARESFFKAVSLEGVAKEVGFAFSHITFSPTLVPQLIHVLNTAAVFVNPNNTLGQRTIFIEVPGCRKPIPIGESFIVDSFNAEVGKTVVLNQFVGELAKSVPEISSVKPDQPYKVVEIYAPNSVTKAKINRDK